MSWVFRDGAVVWVPGLEMEMSSGVRRSSEDVGGSELALVEASDTGSGAGGVASSEGHIPLESAEGGSGRVLSGSEGAESQEWITSDESMAGIGNVADGAVAQRNCCWQFGSEASGTVTGCGDAEQGRLEDDLRAGGQPAHKVGLGVAGAMEESTVQAPGVGDWAGVRVVKYIIQIQYSIINNTV